jgi:MFS transporter, SET family, sugar efflux transporter
MNEVAAPVRAFATLATAVLLLGIADSMVGSYAVLFAADEVGLSPVQVGVFSSAPAVGGIVVSTLLGRRFDRQPTRFYAAVVSAAGALGLGLYAVTRSFPLLVLVAATLLGAVTAAFPQLFALARVALGSARAAPRSAPLLRSSWSLAWAIGPLIGAALLAARGYPTLLLTAAGILAVTALVTLAVPTAPAATTGRPGHPAPVTLALPVVLATASITLIFTAMYAGSVALPLFVTRELHQPDSAVGVLFSVCAAVEVVAALVLAALPARVSQRLLILGGMGAFVLYFTLTVLATGQGLLLAGQIARGVAVAVVGAAGIRYFQDLLAPATGEATTLFANAGTAGGLGAGILAGIAIRYAGYTGTLALCGAVAAVAALVFWFSSVLGGRPRGPAAAGRRPHDPERLRAPPQRSAPSRS